MPSRLRSSVTNPTGHINSCPHTLDMDGLKLHQNRGVHDQRKACKFLLDTRQHLNCGRQLSKQCCDYQLCTSHWKSFCLDHTDDWDAELSCCANRLADQKQFTRTKRALITQENIQDELNLPNDPHFQHISEKRRRLIDQVQMAEQAAREADEEADIEDNEEDDPTYVEGDKTDISECEEEGEVNLAPQEEEEEEEPSFQEEEEEESVALQEEEAEAVSSAVLQGVQTVPVCQSNQEEEFVYITAI